jgi:hypothetical protein
MVEALCLIQSFPQLRYHNEKQGVYRSVELVELACLREVLVGMCVCYYILGLCTVVFVWISAQNYNLYCYF